jgi:hypothetical protein
MPDWQELVRWRLSSLALDPAEKNEVHAELAAHLEESYEALQKEGVPEKDAVQRTLGQVANWRDLQRRIFIAKRRGPLMQKRMRQLWIPGFLTLTLSMAFLAILQKFGFRPRIIWSGSIAILVYLPWLASLPFFGALGAYLSSRAGGSRGGALFVSVFPVLALAMTFLLMFPIGMTIEWFTGQHMDFSFVATALLKEGIGWLLFPGVALLVGGLLVHLWFNGRSWWQNRSIGSEATHA